MATSNQDGLWAWRFDKLAALAHANGVPQSDIDAIKQQEMPVAPAADEAAATAAAAASSPKPQPSISTGATVRLRDLRSRPDLNGATGRVERLLENDYFGLRVPSDKSLLKIRRANLELVRQEEDDQLDGVDLTDLDFEEASQEASQSARVVAPPPANAAATHEVPKAASAAAPAREDLEKVLLAAIRGDAATVLQHLDRGGAINVRGGRTNTTLLAKAAAGGHLALVDELIRRGASIDIQDDQGVSALHAAAYIGSLPIAQRLLQAKARVDHCNCFGMTAVGWAATRAREVLGCAAVVDLLDGHGFDARVVRQLLTESQIATLLSVRSKVNRANTAGHEDTQRAGHQVIFLHAVRASGKLSAECAAVLDHLVAMMRRHDPRDEAHRAEALRVRCAELHTYHEGSGLMERGHRDADSVLTLSVLLTDPDEFEGGTFLTWGRDEAPLAGVTTPVAHEMSDAGDGVLFWSEDLHNVSPITAGCRQVVVIELWRGKANAVSRMK